MPPLMFFGGFVTPFGGTGLCPFGGAPYLIL
jgi:hypothetical protein